MESSDIANLKDDQLRNLLVKVSLEWEKRFAVAPRVTGDLAEYDAAKLKGASLRIGKGRDVSDTAVKKGVDFRYRNKGYQVKSNRPSGKKGSPVSLVAKAKTDDWDILIWILYDEKYKIREAQQFSYNLYHKLFKNKKRLSPQDMKLGHRLK
jgi:hypothetical protein